MARKLDREKIVQARESRKKENTKEAYRQEIHDTIAENRRGMRRGTVVYPAGKKNLQLEEKKKLRVAAYCRVSTQEEAQVGSFEMQVNHYRKEITSNPDYELVDIYADNGISGTTISQRKQFIRMLEDCEAGKIDLILCKSISRFGRNIVDFLTTIERLSELKPPVAVYFETQGINTGNGGNKLIISILSALAEMESQQRSIAVTAGIHNLMIEGLYKFSVKYMPGLVRDVYGRIKIDRAEADIVTYIYDSFLEGCSVRQIADSLTEQEIPTPMGNEKWSYTTVRGILRNEKYCGDVLYQKTYTVDYLKHVRSKNTELPQYFWEGVHPAIVSKEKWLRVQDIFNEGRRHKKKPKKMEPRLTVTRVKSGALRGFFLVDVDWNKREREQFLALLDASVLEQ